MNNRNHYHHHQYQFPKIFQINNQNANYNKDTYQNHYQNLNRSDEYQQNCNKGSENIQNSNKQVLQGQDKQPSISQSQMMSNLTFSIEDLLSKISKVRSEYEDFQKKPDTITTLKPKISKNQKQKNNTNNNIGVSSKFASKQIQIPRINKIQSVNLEAPSIILHSIQKQAQYFVYQNKQQNVKVVYQKENHRPTGQSSKYEQFLKSCKSQNLLLPEQILKFGNTLQTKETKQWKKSIILDDGKAHIEEAVTFKKQPIGKSLFDGKFIREVASSQIFQNDSPQKNRKQSIQQDKSQMVTSYVIDEQTQFEVLQFKQGKTSNKSIQTNASQKVSMTMDSPINIRDFQLGKCIGSGKFGDVFQAFHKKTNSLYAIKKIFKSTLIEYDMIQQFTRQLKIHYKLNYPNIIKLYTHFSDEYHIFLVMEYAQGGMLMDKIKQGQKFSSIIIQQMLRAVQYLHQNKIAHRDIKPQNIVLMFDDTAKLCDFGWSRVFDSDMKKTFCGTLDYVSPQMKDKGQYSLQIDIWSLGVLTFEIICGFAPFKDEISNWKRKGGNLNRAWNWNILYPPQVSGLAQSFMRNLLKQNPSQRANIRFCRNHLFIRKHQQAGFDQNQQKRFKQISEVIK